MSCIPGRCLRRGVSPRVRRAAIQLPPLDFPKAASAAEGRPPVKAGPSCGMEASRGGYPSTVTDVSPDTGTWAYPRVRLVNSGGHRPTVHRLHHCRLTPEREPGF